jgi:adiponectin receptor
MLVCYLLAAVSCLFTSASWHVLSGCASRRWFEWGACVDYIGISCECTWVACLADGLHTPVS